jgi:hypothetical protein
MEARWTDNDETLDTELGVVIQPDDDSGVLDMSVAVGYC